MEKKALFICCTPLQLLIARNIISLEPDFTYDLIFISPEINHKYQNAYEKSMGFFVDSIIIELKNKISLLKKQDFKKFNEAYEKISDFTNNKDYHSLFLANIDKKIILKLISKKSFRRYISFDDGIENLNTINGVLYKKDKKNFSNFLFKLNGVHLTREKMRSKLEYHYTIYPNHKNLTNKVVPISLKNEIKANNLSSLINEIQSYNSISIFLGSPIENANSSTYLEHPYESILDKIKIDFYYPHPRENFYPKIKLLDYPFIFEDFILDLKLLKPNLKIKIYSFGSSVHLNLINLNNIQHTVINRKNMPINDNVLNIIKLYNIQIIEI